jgi:hypothetical protein
VTRCDTPFARLLPIARGATELPGLFTQCKAACLASPLPSEEEPDTRLELEVVHFIVMHHRDPDLDGRHYRPGDHLAYHDIARQEQLPVVRQVDPDITAREPGHKQLKFKAL